MFIILIIGIISFFYKPTYAVTLNGEFIGYTNDKTSLQKEINEYMKGKETDNIAFVDIETLPEYSLCFVKKENIENNEEIIEKVKNQGVTYYECYAVTLKDEEKDYKAKIDNLKSNNITLLGDLGLNIKLCYILYKKDKGKQRKCQAG